MRPQLTAAAAFVGVLVAACGGDIGTTTVGDDAAAGDTTTEQRTTKAAPKAVTFGQGRASGDFAIASADGTIENPQSIRVLVNAEPNQQVQVTWMATCVQPGGGVGSSDDQFSATTPIDRRLKLPAENVDDCTVAANAQLDKGGSVRVRLRGTEGS